MPEATTQAHRFVAIGTPLGDDVLLFRRGTFCEQLGRPFEYQLDLLSERLDIGFADILGQNVTVRLALREGQTRYFNGFVSRFIQAEPVGQLAHYQATVVPWPWFLTRTSNCRIFQGKTVPEIVQEVFGGHRFTDFEDRLTPDGYPKWEYCAQYRETDFEFVSRLMEQEGIYYYFTHENGKHTLVLADGSGAHEPFPGYEEIPYLRTTPRRGEMERVSSWTVAQLVQPGAYAHTDFNFKNPGKPLLTSSTATSNYSPSHFEIFDYPGEFAEFDWGQQYARMRIEELHADFEVGAGEGDARGIACGSTFRLTDHPRTDQRREYLVTSASYEVVSDVYESERSPFGEAPCLCSFTAIDSARPYRPPRITPKPVIDGPQTAIVVGPQGEEIHTDKYGRVKVQFHWDRHSKADETSSCWIRVAQPWAGKRWGAMFIPRIGQEVIVEFLEGDPDRPIITGRVYNGSVMPPYTLPANKTLSTVKSNSSMGGQGFNEIRFEDKKGEEQIFVHGEKNLDIRVKSSRYETIGYERHLVVKKDKFDHDENNRHEIVDLDHMEEIRKDRHLKVKGKEAKDVGGSLSLTVGGDVIEAFNSNHREETAQTIQLKALNVKVEASIGIELKCGGSSIVLTPAAIFIMGGPLVNINSGSGPPVAPVMAQAVSPLPPKEAFEADSADPGEMAQVKARQRQAQTGKYGSVPVRTHKPGGAAGEEATDEAATGQPGQRTSWVEVQLLYLDGAAVTGEKYRITLPDGSVAEGTTDERGLVRVDDVDPGQCQVQFPNLDGREGHRE